MPVRVGQGLQLFPRQLPVRLRPSAPSSEMSDFGRRLPVQSQLYPTVGLVKPDPLSESSATACQSPGRTGRRPRTLNICGNDGLSFWQPRHAKPLNIFGTVFWLQW
jgi:hypothetical protein